MMTCTTAGCAGLAVVSFTCVVFDVVAAAATAASIAVIVTVVVAAAVASEVHP